MSRESNAEGAENAEILFVQPVLSAISARSAAKEQLFTTPWLIQGKGDRPQVLDWSESTRPAGRVSPKIHSRSWLIRAVSGLVSTSTKRDPLGMVSSQ